MDISNVGLQDFKDLFLRKKSGHLTEYVYIFDDTYYEKLLEYDEYYNGSVEKNILQSQSGRIKELLPKIYQVIELGTGYEISVEAKTINLLKALNSFEVYTAVDSHEEFAKLASRQVSKYFPNSQSFFYQCNILSKFNTINGLLKKGEKDNNCIVCFGNTLGNLDEVGIDSLFNNLQVLTDKGDYLIMGIDFNQDAKSLDAAYNNYWLEQLALNVMRRLKELVSSDSFNPEAFDFVYNWNIEKRTVEISLKAQIDQEIIIEKEHFLIRAGDCFHLINSKKFIIEEVEELMRVNNFQIAEILEEGDAQNPKAKLIVAKKI